MSCALLNITQAGDEIVVSTGLYGGTIDLFHDFEAYGITTKFVDINDHELVKAVINEKTKLVFAETIGNPKLDVADIEALAAIAHEAGIPLIIDNTVASAYLTQPLKLGAILSSIQHQSI